MKTLYALRCFLFLFLFFSVTGLPAQSLSFSKPFSLLPNAKTDKSVSIIHFQRGYFIAWKEPGGFGKLHIAHLEKAHDTDFFEQEEQVLQNEETAFSPALVSLNDRIYIFWISKEGAIKYIINKDQKNFDKNKINTLKFNSAIKVAYGLTAAVVNNKIFIASHADDKNSLLYSLIETGADGGLKEAMLLKVPGKSSPDYPFVASLRDTAVRMAWRNKDGFIYYATYNSVKNKWSEATAIAASKSKYSPVIFGAPNSDRLFYIWSDPKKDSRVYYATKKMDMAPVKATQLPEWFSASSPVSICDMDNKSFLLAFVGAGQHLYMSYFINYNSASWMRDLLMPLKGNYTLKDIAIPGSHDAGMSVLTAAIGQVSGTINPCNTLTQIQDIAAQLNAGIRMFDLRCGTFNKQVYVKHSSSDCIDSAIGGGFGEKLSNITSAINEFIHKNTGEIVLLSFSHFCEKEIAQHALADSIVAGIGKDIIFKKTSKLLSGLTLKELAGKVIITFENYSGSNDYINSNSIANSSVTFMNFRREYAATNDINKMISKQEAFFDGMKNGVKDNDIVRLDWQLTQSPDEAAMVCNSFESEKTSVVVSSIMAITSAARKYKSIIDLADGGNKYLFQKIDEWMKDGKINNKNKPNIVYVDVAGTWVTDYCIDLNMQPLYQK